MTYRTARNLDAAFDLPGRISLAVNRALTLLSLFGMWWQGRRSAAPVAFPQEVTVAVAAPVALEAPTVALAYEPFVVLPEPVAPAPAPTKTLRKPRKAEAPLMPSAAQETREVLFRRVGRRYQEVIGRPVEGEALFRKVGTRYKGA